MIPKKIHYCWFGRGKKPPLAEKCIASWKKYCPDYEIIDWGEDNFDINYNQYIKYCYDNKKWAFLSDYVRLLVVYENGGIYFDTDVELIKSPDDLLNNKAYFGFETPEFINTGLGFGAEKGADVIYAMLQEYAPLADGKHGTIGCPILNTKAILKKGFVMNGQKQEIQGTVIYPIEFLNPLNDATGVLTVTENTYSINHYGKSWLDKKSVIRSRLTRPLHRVFGNDCFAWLKRI